jgi:DNA segregation ATPase FtsK/SpoIIIE, S-DNA-T family
MGIILSVYTSDAFKEFLLSARNNEDYSVILSKKIFKLKNDLELLLEVVDHKWYFHLTDNYSLQIGEKDYNNSPIQDGEIYELTTNEGVKISIISTESNHTFAVFDKYDISQCSEITIGKSESRDIQYDAFGLVSRNHAVIKRQNGLFVLEDQSQNGTYVDSVLIQGSRQLMFGDCISVFGLQLVFLGDVLAVNASNDSLKINKSKLKLCDISYNLSESKPSRKKSIQKQYFNRAPRNVFTVFKDPIEIEAPPNQRLSKKRPFLLTIGPSLTMAIPMLLGSGLAIYSTTQSGQSAGAYMYTGLITALSSTVIGITWAIVNIRYSSKEETEDENKRIQIYESYLMKLNEFINEKYQNNYKVLNDMYPSASECSRYNGRTSLLWNRNHTHADFLTARLGIGNIPFQAPIHVPKQNISVTNDILFENISKIVKHYEKLNNVPIGIDLSVHRLVGVIGGAGKLGALDVARNIAVQIAANHCYTDVKMAFIYDEKSGIDTKEFAYAKWLPHVWSEDKKTRFVASNKQEAGDVFYELTNILRIRGERTDRTSSPKHMKPHYILFVANPELLEGELIAKYILEARPEYGISTLLLTDRYENIPNACDYIIQNDSYFTGAYDLHEDEKEHQYIAFDSITIQEMESFARSIFDVEVNEPETGGDLPNVLNFFDMYKVSSLEQFHVLDRWRKNRTYDSMRALIGQKAGGADCYLDIHEKYHGPHGLIAGTTGSGKSETLQTYILSLALNFSPLDIGFFIIDFKGGGMANLFSNLPHMMGQISNLSGNQVRRAMVSIKSENMRRQRIFSEHGVNNINLYTRMLKKNEATIPVPHLFIIIDEFAELKREEPDFMRELISVAQVGRSLGVHLILATQKPSGTVDENIWSNTKFRLCLRVQDRQDSNDMLHKPDAAYLTHTGRGYMQVGNDEIYELFQSGWSGAVYDENYSTKSAEIAIMRTITGKTALVGNRTKIKQTELIRRNWYTSLISYTKRVMDTMHITAEQCLKDAKVLTLLASETVHRMNEEGIDYPDTKFNLIRMEEFIQLWLESEEQSESDRVDEIIRTAAAKDIKLPEVKEKTQLEAVVEYLEYMSAEHGYVNNQLLWLPVLPEQLYLEALEGYKENAFSEDGWKGTGKYWNLEAYIGLCDDPENQSQLPLVVNLAENGHYAVCGMVMSGKSTFLQTLIYSFVNRYSPEYINIYALDFSSKMLSAFEGLAHVGGILYEDDIDKMGKFFNMMGSILQERKALFKGGNYSQYVQVNGVCIPSILIVIDNYANFREKTDNAYENDLIQLSRDGAGYGIFLVISSAGFGSMEIQSRIGDNIRNVICLEMGDKFKYADAMRTMHIEVLPEADVKGRGLAYMGSSILEYQTALALKSEDDYQRIELIKQCCQRMNQSWKGRKAKRIPEIPEQPVWSEYCQLEDVISMVKDQRKLPIGYRMEDASIYGIDLKDTYCYTVSGKSRTGKTNLLKTIAYSASMAEGELCIIDLQNNELKSLAEKIGARYISTDEEMFTYWKEMLTVFTGRNKKKRSWIEEGEDDSAIFEKMQSEKNYYIIVADLASFLNSIYSPKEGVGAMSGFMENIIEKGRLHNIYFFAGLNVDDVSKALGYKVYQCFTGYKRGAHLGGNTIAQKIFNFNNIPYMEQSKVLKTGIALVPSAEDDTVGEKVVIPLARG